jgi:hypothetical protein
MHVHATPPVAHAAANRNIAPIASFITYRSDAAGGIGPGGSIAARSCCRVLRDTVNMSGCASAGIDQSVLHAGMPSTVASDMHQRMHAPKPPPPVSSPSPSPPASPQRPLLPATHTHRQQPQQQQQQQQLWQQQQQQHSAIEYDQASVHSSVSSHSARSDRSTVANPALGVGSGTAVPAASQQSPKKPEKKPGAKTKNIVQC